MQGWTAAMRAAAPQVRSIVAVAAVVVVLLSAGGRAPAAPAAPPTGVATPSAVAEHGAGAVLPVDGPVMRTFDPPATPYGPGHRGVDLGAAPGTPVRAALGGRVTFAGPVARRGWVTVDHGGGLDTTYGPVDPRRVRAGERVRAGQVLGLLAAGQRHLDWGARLHGAYIDPLALLGRWDPHLVATAS